MCEFFSSLDAKRKYVVFELFFVYFALGIACIILGSVLPDLRAADQLDYAQGGLLLSIQSAGYLLIGLFTGRAAAKAGLKTAFVGIYALLPLGLILLLIGSTMPPLSVGMFFIGLAKGSITDYNNRIISDYSGGSAAPLNLLHAFFALGACIAPLIALAFKRHTANGWLNALIMTAVLAAVAFVTGLFMKIDEKGSGDDEGSKNGKGPAESPEAETGKGPAESPEAETGKGQADSPETEAGNDLKEKGSVGRPGFAFFREPVYISTLMIAIFYQAVEASLMGWLTSFYLDTGVMEESSAQIVTSALWISLLAGRLFCSAIAGRFRPWQMLNVMCAGMAVFMGLLILGKSFPVLLVATVGLGLCMAGMYGTGVSNAGHLFSEYSEAMGYYVTLNGLGAAAGPALVGLFANVGGLRKGFAVLFAACIVLAVSAAGNTALFIKMKAAGKKLEE